MCPPQGLWLHCWAQPQHFTISAVTWGLSLPQVFFLFFWEVHVITQQIRVSGSRRDDRPHSANNGPCGWAPYCCNSLLLTLIRALVTLARFLQRKEGTSGGSARTCLSFPGLGVGHPDMAHVRFCIFPARDLLLWPAELQEKRLHGPPSIHVDQPCHPTRPGPVPDQDKGEHVSNLLV